MGVFWHFSCGYYFSMLTVDRVAILVKKSLFFWACGVTAALSFFLLSKGLWEAFKRQKGIFVFTVGAFIFPLVFLAAFYSIRLNARYLSFAAPIFFILVSAGIASIRSQWMARLVVGVLTFVSVVGSVNAILIKTDAIHKEDFKSLIRFAFEKAGEKDAVCGLKDQVKYYRMRLHLSPKAVYFPGFQSLHSENTGGFQRIWVVDSVNMHPQVFERSTGQLYQYMEALGFVPLEKPSRFGGEEGLTVLYVFGKKIEGGTISP